MKRRKSRASTSGGSMGPATVRMHMAAFEAAGRDWWRTTIQTASNLQLFPGLAELTQRETEVLEIRGVSPLDVSKRQVFIVGKTLPWCRVPTDKVPCLPSNVRMYLTHRRRLAIGVELLRCNGITSFACCLLCVLCVRRDRLMPNWLLFHPSSDSDWC